MASSSSDIPKPHESPANFIVRAKRFDFTPLPLEHNGNTPHLSIPSKHGPVPDTNEQVFLDTVVGDLIFHLYHEENTNGCYVDEINRMTGRILADKASNVHANEEVRQCYADALMFIKMAQLAMDRANWKNRKFSDSDLEKRACPDVNQSLPSYVTIKSAVNRLHTPYRLKE